VQSEGFQDIKVPISQLGAPPSLLVTEAAAGIVLLNNNREFTLEIIANFEVAVDLPDWIDENGANPGANGRTWSFIAQSMTEGTREADITVRANNPAVSVSPVTVHVSQTVIPIDIDLRPVQYAEFYDGNTIKIVWGAAPADNAYVEVEWQKQDYTTGNVHVTPETNTTVCDNAVQSPSAVRYRSVVVVDGNEVAGGWQTCQLPQYSLIMIGSATDADWNMDAADQLTFNPENPYVYTWTGHLRWGEFNFYVQRAFSGINMGPILAGTFSAGTTPIQLINEDSGRSHKWYVGEFDQGNYDVVVNLNEMTITFTAK
jgi:hypothetical protein